MKRLLQQEFFRSVGEETAKRPVEMSNIIRACNPFDFAMMLNFARSRFTGAVSQPINSVLDFLEAKSNLTIQIRSQQDGVGEPVQGSSAGVYDGCIGLLQRNESDVMTQLHDYPMDAININQGDTAFYSTIAYVSLYQPRTTKEVSVSSIDDCFSIFNSKIYSICVAFTLLIFSVVYIRSLLLRGLKQSGKKVPKQEEQEEEDDDSGCTLYELVTHLTGYGSISDSGFFMKTIFLISCIYSFLVLAIYFCGFISTDLITFSPPFIYRTYHDLLEHQVPLVYLRGWLTYKTYKFAPENSQQQKLWQLGVKKYGEEDLFFAFHEMSSLLPKAADLLDRKIAMAFDSSFTGLILVDQCAIANDRIVKQRFKAVIGHNSSDLQPYVSIDPNEKLLLKGVIYSDHFRGPLFKLFRSRLITLRETGLVHKVLEMVQVGGWASMLRAGQPSDPDAHGKIRQCMDNIILVPEVDLQGVTVENVRSFILLCFYVILMQFLVLLVEVLIPRKGRERQMKTRKQVK